VDITGSSSSGSFEFGINKFEPQGLNATASIRITVQACIPNYIPRGQVGFLKAHQKSFMAALSKQELCALCIFENSVHLNKSS